MFDEDDDVEVIDENGTQPPSSFGGELQPSPRTYYPPVPSQYPLPQYLPQQYPQYVPRYEQPPKHEAPPKYEPTPKYEPKPIYENPAAAVPKYVPQYRPPQYSSAPCGSNLLIGCQPRVQAVPCYPPSSYSAPPAHSQSYKPPNPTGYPPVPLVKPAAAVYLQPGPPYPEPVTLSASNARNQVQTENTENTSPIEQRQDSEPESSNIERKTNESDHEAEDLVGTANVYPKTDATTEPPTTTTTMTTTTTTTTAPAPATTTTLKPSTEEQIRRLHEKLDNHLEDIKRLKEDSGKRLRAAIERSNSRSAVDEFEDMANIFDESAPFAKRHSLNRDLADNTVW
ncbi:uncharacterized protein LOC129574038 [Sitodiplosis mosellana]|uniref:uncharacterized protein LOC129574038 n=1 Tax=Sitodiplosis mosellana TaxID=263140 RepID=UPI002443A904|nr:uncharacterized protein LOC129574038 [Sitodiplosis mosellana]